MEEIGIFKIDKKMCNNCRKDEDCLQKYSPNGNCLYGEKDLKKERVPENWEEVLELCKKLNNKKIEIIFVDIRIIVHLEDNCEINFTETMGAMWFKKNDFETRIRIDLTPQQMWNIIKSLVEEK